VLTSSELSPVVRGIASRIAYAVPGERRYPDDHEHRHRVRHLTRRLSPVAYVAHDAASWKNGQPNTATRIVDDDSDDNPDDSCTPDNADDGPKRSCRSW
jgi:hypothetical protein